MTAREELAAEVLWESIRDNLPESFWDAAVWVGPNWLTGRLDVADRKRIALALLASPALATLIRGKQAEAWDEGAFAGGSNQREVMRLAHWSHIGKATPDLIRNPYRCDDTRPEDH